MAFDIDMSKLLNKFDLLSQKASSKVADKALDSGADPILKEQQNLVPVYKNGKGKPRRVGGRLKQSLGKSKITGSGTNRKINIGIQNPHEREVVYGYYQEYGTDRQVGKKWMKRSFIKSKKASLENIKKVLQDELTNI